MSNDLTFRQGSEFEDVKEAGETKPEEPLPKAYSPALKRFKVRTLKEIVEDDYPNPAPILRHFMNPGETALLIARQKEGKSTLALQLAIDVGTGSPFLDRYPTEKGSVLYVDYENRPYRLKIRGADLAKGRPLDNISIVAYDLISDRDVGLFGEEYANLQEIVRSFMPSLLVVDPLRYAILKDTSDERAAVEALDQVSHLREENPPMAVLLVHHLKKAQDNLTPELRQDTRTWIEQVYGSQALLAHVENIWGLEHDSDGYALGTVSRSEESFVIALEKEPSSQRFKLSPTPVQIAGMSPALREAWGKLPTPPTEFSWSEAMALGIPNSTLDRLIRYARPAGLLVQDTAAGKYRKSE